MKQIAVEDETYKRLMALCARLEWDMDKTLRQIIEDAEDLQTEIEEGEACELEAMIE